jgi:hypothetical protein
MMYVVFNIDYIHHLLNEPKMWIFAYNNDWRVYVFERAAEVIYRSVVLLRE